TMSEIRTKVTKGLLPLSFDLWKRGRQIQSRSKAKAAFSNSTEEMRTRFQPGRPVGRLAFAFAVHAPSRGRAEVLRSGQPGMDAGLAAPGHGWPMAAGPRSRTGARAP